MDTTVNKQLGAIQNALPLLDDLGPQERQPLAKMGDTFRAFIARTLDLAQMDYSSLLRVKAVTLFVLSSIFKCYEVTRDARHHR